MARYFASNTLAGFFRTNVAIVEDTTASTFDSTFTNVGIRMNGASTDYIETYDMGSVTGTVWTHFEVYIQSFTSGAAMATWVNGSTNCYRIVHSTGSTFKFQYWNGSAWVDNGTTFSVATSSRVRFDVKIVLNTSWEVYQAGTSVASGSTTTGGTTITKLRLNLGNNGGEWFSQVMVADFDTRDSRLFLMTLNGNSATNTGGTGAYTTVNETVLDESTAINIATSTNKQGQTHSAVTVPAGYSIGAVVVNARGRVNGTITDGKLGVRSGSTNYSSTGRSYNGGYEPRGYFWETDPNTAATWTQTNLNNAEIYEEAV